LAAAVVLAGCATVDTERDLAPVQKAATDHLGKSLAWPQTDAARDEVSKRVADLLVKPLDADAAVQVALLNNRGLRAAFHDLGIADADLVQAGRLPNPGFAFARKTQGSAVEIERLFVFNIAHLIAMPLTIELESRRFDQTQRLVTQQMLALAAQTRQAYYLAVAADESLRYQRQVMAAAEAAAELSRRMAEVGNWNRLQQSREQGFYADAALRVARAGQLQTTTRERLTRLLGLWGPQTAFTLSERLPDLPREPEDRPDIEQFAMAQRLDVQAARLATEQLASNLGLTRTTRFVNVFEVGVIHNTFNDGAPSQRGYEIGFEIPLFDWGDARVAKAEQIYMQSVERAAETAVNARSEVRQAYLGYRSAYDIARHWRDEIVPLRKRISEENLLRYNGMLIGVFELLADAQAQIASVNGYIEALRDFWLARAELDMALIGAPGPSAMAVSTPMAAESGAAH
jgi:outer membrane protein TolC